MVQADTKKCIFVVEDSREIQFLIARLLKKAGYEVICANNGREALERLRTCDPTPGLILLDLMMPDMDGYEFRCNQEKDSKIANIPVVIMTADREIESKAMKVGAKAFLKKPFTNVADILATIAAFFPNA